jgi:hypothetical protein
MQGGEKGELKTAMKSKSASPIKRPGRVGLGPVVDVPYELNTSVKISNSISLFQSAPYRPIVTPATISRGGRVNSTTIAHQMGTRKSSINSALSNGSRLQHTGSLIKTRPAYIRPDGKRGRQRMASEYGSASKEQSLTPSCGPSSRHVRIRCASAFEHYDTEAQSVLTASQLSELYAAKCQDLHLERFESQEYRFHDFGFRNCIDGKVLLREVPSLYPCPSSVSAFRAPASSNR